MADTDDIPDVGDTDLTREELEEVAEDLGVDPEGMDDQELLERLGVELGELDAADRATNDDSDDGGPETDDRDSDDRDADDSAPSTETDAPRRDRLRSKVADRLRGAAERVRPEDGEGDADERDERAAADERDERAAEDAERGDAGHEDSEGRADEQPLPGEPIEGPTRDELRDRLRELGLPVSGTKDELQARLEEAEPSSDGPRERGGAEDGGGARGLVADKLEEVADRLRSSGEKQARRKAMKGRRRELIRARRADRLDAAKSFVRQLRR